jgi:transcriptional regulator with XRE-family HTH domain
MPTDGDEKVARSDPRFGEVIRRARNAKGWKAIDLSAATNFLVHTSEISRMETGKLHFPGLVKLRALAEALDIPAGQLLALSRYPGQPIFHPATARVMVRVRPEDEEILEGLARFLTQDDPGEVDVARLERTLDAARAWLRNQRGAEA